ncbi:histidinol-phosphate aminotransferase [Blastocladiella britannica]|nr:histidinol-phosphate aminotransferase [Blastocladiella britannica]
MPAPPSFNLQQVIRPNIWALKPYRCARDDYSVGILLDANENAYGPAVPAADLAASSLTADELARYPDPHQHQLKSALAAWRSSTYQMDDTPDNALSADNVFLGVGSDEVIDLLMRVACAPGRDKILVCPPTYGMYTVSADINDVGVVRVPLVGPMFSLDAQGVCAALKADPAIKLVFLCSPGNPTGSFLEEAGVRQVLECDGWNGLVVVDEAYIDFCTGTDPSTGARKRSAAALVSEYANLVVAQTFSKSFGMAGVRLGVAYGHPSTIAVLSKTKAPYNISNPTAKLGLAALSAAGLSTFAAHVDALNTQRAHFLQAIPTLPRTGRVLGTNDANFVLAEVLNAHGVPCNATALALYKTLAESMQVVVRYRGNEPGCTGCVRVTIGTEQEQAELTAKWRLYFASA